MGFFGFNNKRKSTLGGDFDGDGVKNKKDCEPMNWKKQDKSKILNRYRNIKTNKIIEKWETKSQYENHLGDFDIDWEQI